MALQTRKTPAHEVELVLTGDAARELVEQLFGGDESLDDEEAEETFVLQIAFPDDMPPDDVRNVYTGPLAVALQREELGRLTEAVEPDRRVLEASVRDLDAGIECVQRVLKQAGAPRGTTILIDQTVEIGLYDDDVPLV